MGRYKTDIVVCDGTTKAGWNCTRSFSPGQGACLFQLTGGTGGCGITGNENSGRCCLWVVPAGVTSVIVELWGGGGGGGGSPGTCFCCYMGHGGGGGAYSRKTLTGLTAGQSYTVCAGAGGWGGGMPGGMSGNSCCCGSKGSTSFMTGTGLSNFCSDGGYGGDSRCYWYQSANQINGGYPGTGGDINVKGYDGGLQVPEAQCWQSGWTYGGGSPFGGRNMYMGAQCDTGGDICGNLKHGSLCGQTGNFPGGGGTGGYLTSGCSQCACGGNGSAGLVRIWM